MRTQTADAAGSHRAHRNFIPTFCFLLLALIISICSSMFASTGYKNEISNLHVENTTQTSVDIVWDTVHPSTSQAIIARDTNYQPEIRVPWTVSNGGVGPTGATAIGSASSAVAPTAGPTAKMSTVATNAIVPTGGGDASNRGATNDVLAIHHRVTITGLRPYNAFYRFGTYYYYVVSVDVNGVMSTAPGPVDYVTTSLPSFQTRPVDTTAPQSFLIYTSGPTNVFAGSDLYFTAELHQLGGSKFGNFTDVVNQTGIHNGSDGVVTGLTPATKPSAGTIGVNLACSENLPTATEQSKDFSNPTMWGCYTSYSVMPSTNFRLRTSASTAPGPYQVTFTFVNSGVPTTGTYQFNVVAAPTFRTTPPALFPAIPGRANWETQMVTLGHRWCDAHNGLSTDDKNASGHFQTGWGWQEDTWFYDGGRVYQQVDDYTSKVVGQPNHALWQHCAQTVLDPYREYMIANNGAVAGYSMFSYGMEMDYQRTHNPDDLPGIKALIHQSGNYGGFIDWYGIRETAYYTNNRIAAEMLGQPHDPLTNIGIDKLLGHLDQYTVGGKVNTMHPFMAGLAMQTLITWYEWQASRGVYDNRIPVTIKSVLDAQWTIWNAKHYTLAYNATILPSDDAYSRGADTVDWVTLNGLVAPAYAWYWSKTGDQTVLAHGDLLFQHTLDPAGVPTWSGKMYSQMFSWTPDYVGWRSTRGYVPAVLPSQNPYTGPVPDSEPPIMGGSAYAKVTATPASTDATITWKTYEPATTQVKFGITAGYGSVTPANQLLTTSHTVVVTGLLPRTTYHYQANSVDAAGNVAALQDQTFTTAQ